MISALVRPAAVTRAAIVGLFVFLAACTVPEPRTAAPGEIAAVQSKVDGFLRALDNDDFETLVDTTFSPRLMRGLAAESGFTVANFRAYLIEALEETDDLDLVTVENFDIVVPSNPEFRDIVDPTLSGNGALITWTMLRSDTTLSVNLGDIDPDVSNLGFRQRSNVAAIKDEGDWYLITVSDETDAALLEPYYPFIEWAGVPESEVDILFLRQGRSLIAVAKAAAQRARAENTN